MPLRLDDTTNSQRLLSYARVLVNLNVAKASPGFITIDFEGDVVAEVAVQYENVPCLDCLAAGHLTSKCPF